MSNFGRTLFGGSRFIFWCVGPLSLLCGLGCVIGAPFALAAKDWKAGTALVLLGICGVCLFLALLNSKRFLWAARVVTGIVALCYVLYFAETYFVEKQSLTPSQKKSEATPWNAIMGFVVIGLPCIWFTVRGRFRSEEGANQSSEPTVMSVTPRADARVAPATTVAHL
jgi:cell division protein FtsW (lipid II flippase)